MVARKRRGLALTATVAIAACAGGSADPSGNPGFTSLGSGQTTGTTESGEDPTTDSPTTGSPTGETASPTTGPDDSDTTTGPVQTTTAGTDDTADTGAPCGNDGDCDDGDGCTVDTCLASGSCSSAPLDCDDQIPCTVDDCDPIAGACTHAPDDALCDDADACNGQETCDAAVGCQAGMPVSCSDQDACTMDQCNPADGSCSFPLVDTCTSGDGCCPQGCSVQQDNDCTCTNIAPSATPSSSGGGQNSLGYGPNNWTDGINEAGCVAASCQECYGWISNGDSPSGAYLQLSWAGEVVIGSMVLDTNRAAEACSAGFGRWPYSGQVQYWNGASWVNVTSWNAVQGDIVFDFDPPLQTTQLRLFNVVTPPGGLNSLAYEWYVYEPLGCSP